MLLGFIQLQLVSSSTMAVAILLGNNISVNSKMRVSNDRAFNRKYKNNTDQLPSAGEGPSFCPLSMEGMVCFISSGGQRPQEICARNVVIRADWSSKL